MSFGTYEKSAEHKHRPGKMLGTTLVSVLAIVMLVLSACGGGGGSTPGQSSNKKVTITYVPSPKGDNVSNYNPFSPNAGTGTQGFLYETLLFINRYTGVKNPWLASSFNQSSDLKTITFKIRDGVKWNDGQPLTSDDVLFTFNLMKTNTGMDTNGLWTRFIQDVAAPDATTFTVTLKQPSSVAIWWIGGGTYIVPKHAWQSVSDPVKFANDQKPVGSGPYLLDKNTPQLVTYKKNPGFWQASSVHVDQIRVPAIKDNSSAVLMLANGQLDWLGVAWDPKLDASYTQKDPEHLHHWFTPSNAVMFYMNTKKYPFNILEVRQAISLAIDRDDIYKKAAVFAQPASPTSILPSQKSQIASQYADSKFTVDTAKSESLLQKAGFTKGSDGIYADKSGKKISFNMIAVSGWDDWVGSTKLISTYLKKIGIDAKINTVGDFTPYINALQTGSFDAGISWTNPGPTPYFQFSDLLDGRKTAPLGQVATVNWERWDDPATNKLLQQYETSNDTAVQKAAIDGLQKIMVEQVPAIPLNYNVTWDEYTTTHVTGWPDEKNPYDYAAPTNTPDNEYIILQLKAA
ncbi:peptide ABC transporter substrate-binding protein [Dictyobacter vulcani]|uniref:Peptide ABC transporter substrate-binding protein n=1 Tax=Dictyobacter vulcani TaxID=2607529 RepID=A0A5J4KPA2_9CHLR|nr:ABC transporter substrate-binding protein [Dictyobacter vulcani]GER91558.1 peptide ABC transporter substrate-binding protein [Dictyobacter vulcani]